VVEAEVGYDLPDARDIMGSITNKVIDQAKLPNRFAELYPLVRAYVSTRCFGCLIDVDADEIRNHLARLEIQEGVAKYLANSRLSAAMSSSIRLIFAYHRPSRLVGAAICRRLRLRIPCSTMSRLTMILSDDSRNS
jgi:hypothetical protein